MSPASFDETYQASTTNPRSGPTRWLAMLLVLGTIVVVGAAWSATQDQVGDDQSEVVTLAGADLPPALRLSTFTGYLAAYVEKDVQAAHHFLHRSFGLNLSKEELLALVGLRGDFDAARRQYYEHELSKPGLQPAERTALGRSQVVERLQFEGGVLGEWAAVLRENGHDVDQFLFDVVQAPNLAVTATYSGDIPTTQALNQRAKLFEAAFGRAYGRTLQQILRQGSSKEGN